MGTLEEYVDALYADADVQRMLALAATTEPLRICYPKEVNVSRFVAWLLDPAEGHGLGDSPVRSLLTKAGQSERAANLSANDRRFLAAASVHTQAFSAMVVTTEVEVGDRTSKKLDVLAVDPAARLYIAVENKFGAKEGADQTKSYRKGLTKLLQGYRGVHIYLDSNEAEPADDAWLVVGYDWLADFLRSCEQRESVAPHVKQTLSQFRSIVEDEDEDSAASTPLGRLITHVASKYGEPLSQMRALVRPAARSTRAKELSELVKAGLSTNESKAALRLFQLYCRRPTVWDQCFRQTLFAPFNRTLRERFAELQVDPRRVVTTFGLADWDRFLETEDKDTWYWCAGVRIQYSDEHFDVTSYVHLVDVKAEKREALLDFANAGRAANKIRSARRECDWLALKRANGLTTAQAVEEAVEQLLTLQRGLDAVR